MFESMVKEALEVGRTMKEIHVYAMTKEKEAKMLGLSFSATTFIDRVEHTRLTTHMDLRQAFEYERRKNVNRMEKVSINEKYN